MCKIGITLLLCVLCLAGCETLAPAEDAPALLENPDSVSREALRSAVDSALGTSVRLADDALTANSLLSIGNSSSRSMQGSVAQGRILDRPIQFQLVRNGTRCVLIDLRNDSRYVLDGVSCEPEE